MRIRVVAVAAILAVALPAFGVDLDRSDAADLARRAADGDAIARSELLAVDSVGGDPVDIAAALDGAAGEEETARLRTLARIVTYPSPPANTAERARTILAQPRFDAPTPSWWDRLWRRLLTRFLDFLGRLGSVPGGGVALALVTLGAVVALAVAVSAELGRRRARRVETERSFRRAAELGFDPDTVDRAAEEAAHEGHWSEAVRLRFLAGLLRLDADGVVRFAPGLTNHEVAETLRSPTFDRLAEQFDAIVYGGRQAGPDDDTTCRRGWAELLGALRR